MAPSGIWFTLRGPAPRLGHVYAVLLHGLGGWRAHTKGLVRANAVVLIPRFIDMDPSAHLPSPPHNPRHGDPPEISRVRTVSYLTMIDEEIQMKQSRFSEAQTMAILQQSENGVPVPDLGREHGMSGASLHWRRAKLSCPPGIRTLM